MKVKHFEVFNVLLNTHEEFLTLTINGSDELHVPIPLPPRPEPPEPVGWKDRQPPEQVWTLRKIEKSLVPVRILIAILHSLSL
jgi:hypothetical protein